MMAHSLQLTDMEQIRKKSVAGGSPLQLSPSFFDFFTMWFERKNPGNCQGQWQAVPLFNFRRPVSGNVTLKTVYQVERG